VDENTANSQDIRFFTAQHADPHALDDERIAVIGYGHLGRPFALNLRDSLSPRHAALTVGNIADEYAEQATADGFAVLPIGPAAAAADIVLVLLPDEVIPEVFAADIAPSLSPGSAIVFASGYNLAYGLIAPPAGIDILLLAPRMAGENARQRFLNGEGFFAYVSVEQDASGKAWQRVLGLSGAAGVLQAGAIELDARREADLDLFIEQTMGALVGLSIMTAFTIGTEAGIPPEAMVMEMYMSQEMEMVFRSFREAGFYRASSVHGPTALYGGFVRTMQFLPLDLGGLFRQVLAEIQSGQFARQFQAEREAGYPMLRQAEALSSGDPASEPIGRAETSVRAMLG
jgi:ketol-acid reductoisomerase